jgi:hypothetical protein
MSESQSHGFKFENIVKMGKLSNVMQRLSDKIGYTSKWDIPPISIKSFKFGSKTIEFGSIERMFANDTSFILVMIGYNQVNDTKSVVFSDALLISDDILSKFKDKLNLDTIHYLCSKIKTFGIGEHNIARDWAKLEKKKYNSRTRFDIRFKIDSKKQRRIQCALKLSDIYDCSGVSIKYENSLCIPNLTSPPRVRNKNS